MLRKGSSSWPVKVNILLGALDDSINLEVLANAVLVPSTGSSDTPTYTIHLPARMPSYAAASACYRMLAGIFISSVQRPKALNLVSPSGADEDLLKNALSWLSIPGDGSRPVTFLHFLQLWTLASDIIPTLPFPYTPASTQLKRGEVHHPLRHKPTSSTLYSRFIPHLKEHFQLKLCTAEEHLQLLHEWMNNPRVAANWEEDGPIEKHAKFLSDLHANPADLPVIGQYVGDRITPACFFAVYWTKEDRLGEYYDAGEYDRGALISDSCLLDLPLIVSTQASTYLLATKVNVDRIAYKLGYPACAITFFSPKLGRSESYASLIIATPS